MTGTHQRGRSDAATGQLDGTTGGSGADGGMAMSEFPSLATVIDKHTPHGSEPRIRCWCDDQFNSFRQHAEHAAEMWREACTITTVEQLIYLPAGSVISTRSRGSLEKFADGRWYRPGWRDSVLLTQVVRDFPIVLIWSPEWSQP